MTRSIFDPSNPNVERSGDRYTGADASQISHMPASAVDGVVDRKDAGPDNVGFDAAGEPVAAPTPAAGPLEADGGLDEVGDAHAVNMEKRNQAEA
jgi:hypothetical protein